MTQYSNAAFAVFVELLDGVARALLGHDLDCDVRRAFGHGLLDDLHALLENDLQIRLACGRVGSELHNERRSYNVPFLRPGHVDHQQMRKKS
jgi:hypothetical protein